MKKILLIICSIFIMLIIPLTDCHAEQSKIDLGPISLSLGMEKNDTISKIKKYYNIECVQGDASCDSILVRDSKQYLGNVYFKNGRLKFILKSWNSGFNQGDKNLVDFINVLFSLIKNFEEEGSNTAVVQTGETRQPTSIQKVIFISFGKKRIEISGFEGTVNGNPLLDVGITEVLDGRK